MQPFFYNPLSKRIILVCWLTSFWLTFFYSTSSIAQVTNTKDVIDNTTSYQPELTYGADTKAPAMVNKALKQTLDSFETKLRELEVEHGPYHTSIANTLTNIARIYSALGEHEQARSGVTRALEVQRISAGLYGAGQIPIVEQLIQVNRTLENWSAVDKNYEFLYWVHRRLHGENSAELMPVLQIFIDWKIEAINGGLFGRRQKIIRDAIKATKQAIVIINNTPDLQHMTSFYMQLEKSLRAEDRAETAQNTSGF